MARGMSILEVGESDVDDKLTLIFEKLRNVIDPDAGDDIVSAGQVLQLKVADNGDINFSLMVQSLTSPLNEEKTKLCKNELSTLSWAKQINIEFLTSEKAKENKENTIGDPTTQTPGGMLNVKHVIAVSSCKGGVGKSTIAVNLAYTLKKAGAKVGILDADIYGPSLPTMTKPLSTEVVFANNQLRPLEYDGVKLMSMGFINKGASIMRGPMVNQILNQFVQLCNWGDLDYLIVDMPPGTGDIQLTLAQIMDISAAVIVTTPQRLSFVDVVKGIDLFDTVNIPCVAVVDNMAEYSTYSFPPGFYEALGSKAASAVAVSTAFNSDPVKAMEAVTKVIQQEIEAQKKPKKIFGEGHNSRLREMWGIENIVSVPLIEEVSASGDSGIPYILRYPDSEVAGYISELAAGVVKELDRLKSTASARAKLAVDRVTNEIIFEDINRISAKKLRLDCRCATCVEEFTGKKLVADSAAFDLVKPMSTGSIGRYAQSIDWSDGHKSLYPFKQIAALIEAEAKKSEELQNTEV
eukprot:CAMPEP_0119034928 /NCGR_PEP_ID=MMETSP1177-20130426/1939_1 /TAXON_ID=2985 /ORGANISM="Ochromonas sp, Strain CCMP1899" /LENGTH=521 /DNA_ID=CAMNT_0006992757 /DNA_START=195 /DNA_END=1760 /DNA_ORIENTATION=+